MNFRKAIAIDCVVFSMLKLPVFNDIFLFYRDIKPDNILLDEEGKEIIMEKAYATIYCENGPDMTFLKMSELPRIEK